MDFRLDLGLASQRRIRVCLDIDQSELPEGGEAEFFMPVWTPGSYLVREYSGQILGLEASNSDSGEILSWRKSSKNCYRVEIGAKTKRLRLAYQVYAHELSVRTSFASNDFVYWNGATVFLWPRGGEHRSARLIVGLSQDQHFSSGLEQSDVAGEVVLRLENLDHAVDSPCLVSAAEQMEFDACGKRHTMVLCGLEGIEPPSSLLPDCVKVIEASAAIFSGELPYENYTFLCLFAEAGRGGLEHRNSSTLLAPRSTFHPRRQYEDFLSLVAHEHFHAWNGKRMRPADLWKIDYERENYSELLWVVEGFTAYYDDHLCLRAEILSRERYLEILCGHVSKMMSMPGRLAQSLCEASFDAWIRFYRPDENTLNATQNYYSNGALTAFCLDARIRAETDGRRSLDEVLAKLYQGTFVEGRGYTREDLSRCLDDVAESDLDGFLSSMVDGAFEPDLDSAFAVYGLTLQRSSEPRLHVGLNLHRKDTRIARVIDLSPAHRAGLAPDDEVLALNGLRVTNDSFSSMLAQLARKDQPLKMLVSRRGKILEQEVVPEESTRSGYKIVADATASESQLSQRNAWLHGR